MRARGNKLKYYFRYFALETSVGHKMGYTHVGENVGDEKSLGDNKTTWREKSAVGENKVQLARKKCSW